MENAHIAQIFEQIAALLELEDGNPFRIRSFRRAAQVLETLSFSVDQVMKEDAARLHKVPGIGAGTMTRIQEILQTGSCRELQSMGERVPLSLLDLLRVSSLGPKKVKRLWKETGIQTLEQLREAAAEGRLRKMSGMGPRSEEQILSSIELLLSTRGRHRLDRARKAADSLAEYLENMAGPERIAVAGSLRRWKETIRDIDILVTGSRADQTVQSLLQYPAVTEVVASGPTKASVRLGKGPGCDLRIVESEEFGSALQYFTGSKEHNVVLREQAKRRGFKINEYGLFRTESDERVAGSEEQELYSSLGFAFIPPELRENRGELEKARQGRLPDLVTAEQLRGELHTHTTDSDGKDHLEDMVSAALSLGYEYLAITDHSRTLAMVGGLDEEGVLAQCRQIDRLNLSNSGLTVLTGIEVDILPDGGLDMSDEVLARLDVVIAAIHSRFDLSRNEMTSRICRALQNPYVNILAHPTGRILFRRRPYEVDLEQVISCAREQRVCLEINAHPKRLDLNDVAARMAYDQGALIAVNSDAHSHKALHMIEYGVATARRAWLTAESVVNCYPLERLIKVLSKEEYRV